MSLGGVCVLWTSWIGRACTSLSSSLPPSPFLSSPLPPPLTMPLYLILMHYCFHCTAALRSFVCGGKAFICQSCIPVSKIPLIINRGKNIMNKIKTKYRRKTRNDTKQRKYNPREKKGKAKMSMWRKIYIGTQI